MNADIEKAPQATVDAPELPYTERGQEVFNVLWGIAEQIWERGKERTAEYLADAGIYVATVSHKYRNGKYYRRIEYPSGKRSTVSYDLRTQIIAVNGKPIKGKDLNANEKVSRNSYNHNRRVTHAVSGA